MEKLVILFVFAFFAVFIIAKFQQLLILAGIPSAIINQLVIMFVLVMIVVGLAEYARR